VLSGVLQVCIVECISSVIVYYSVYYSYSALVVMVVHQFAL